MFTFDATLFRGHRRLDAKHANLQFNLDLRLFGPGSLSQAAADDRLGYNLWKIRRPVDQFYKLAGRVNGSRTRQRGLIPFPRTRWANNAPSFKTDLTYWLNSCLWRSAVNFTAGMFLNRTKN